MNQVRFKKRRLLAACLLITPVYLTSLSANAETASEASETPIHEGAHAINYEAIDALQRMGDYLRSLQQFQVTNDLISEEVLEDGQKLQMQARAVVWAQKPNKLRVFLYSGDNERQIFYDGQKVNLFTPNLNFYTSVPAGNSIRSTIDYLRKEYAIDLPLTDIFVWGSPNAPTNEIQSALNAGQEFIGTDLCNHYLFRQGLLDWQIWISASDHPLPKKVVITNRRDEARPQTISRLTWNFKHTFKNSDFRFVPSKHAKFIQIHPSDASMEAPNSNQEEMSQ